MGRKVGEIAVDNRWMRIDDRDYILHLQKTAKKYVLFCELAIEKDALKPIYTDFLLYEQQGFVDFEIDAMLGEGGMGIVYLVTHKHQKRALKIYKHPRVDRFTKEVAAIQRLQNPCIVEIYDMGTSPKNYIIMEYIQGETFTQYIKKHESSYTEIANIFCRLAKALDYMHQEKIIHRDIKPSNIMIDSNGNPKILDFGIAHLGDQETLFQEMLGTFGFMSPEQLDGKRLDHRSDIYSLGKTLYCAITHTDIFEEYSNININRAVQLNQNIQRPKKLNPKVPQGLERICLKCLETDPNKRFQSAADLAENLQFFMDGKSVKAPAFWQIALLRLWQRNRFTLAITMLIFVFTLGVFSGLLYNLWRKSQLQFAEIALEQAFRSYHEKNWSQCGLNAGIGLQTAKQFSTSKAQTLQRKCRDILRNALSNYKLFSKWKIHQNKKSCLAFSNDGKYLASGGKDGSIKIWEITGKQLQALTLNSTINSIVFSPDDQFIACACDNQTIQLWKISSGKKLFSIKAHNDKVRSIQFSHNGKWLISTANDNSVKLWDIETQKLQQSFAGHSNHVTSALFSEDDKYLFSASKDNSIIVWEIATGLLVKRVETYQKRAITCIRLNSQMDLLASSSGDGKIKVWKLQYQPQLELFLVGELSEQKGPIHDIVFGNFGKGSHYLFSASEDYTVQVWDLTTLRKGETFYGHNNYVYSLALNRSSKYLASTSADDTICVWDISCLYDSLTLEQFSHNIRFLEASSDQLLCASSEKIYTLDMNYAKDEIYQGKNWIKSFALNLSGDKLAFAENKQIKIMNPQTQKIHVLGEHLQDVRSLAFHPNGRWLASGSKDTTIKIWDLQSNQLVKTLYGHSDIVFSLSWNHKDSLISGSRDGTVRCWSLQESGCVVLDKHGSFVHCVKFDPTNKYFLTASADRTIILWDADQKTSLHHFRGHTKTVYDIAFHPYQRIFATASKDHTIIVWDINTRKQIAVLMGHTDEVRSVRFINFGNTVVSSSEDCTIRYWKTPQAKEINSLWSSSVFQNNPKLWNDIDNIPLETLEKFFNLQIFSDFSIKTH